MPAILAIDPGSTRSGWVLLDGERVTDAGDTDNETVRGILRMTGREWEAVVIEEMVSWGGIPRPSTITTAIWIGRFIEAALPVPTTLLRRQSVMKALRVPHQATAKQDAAVRELLIDRWGGGSARTKGHVLYAVTGDAWQALALAVAYQEGLRP